MFVAAEMGSRDARLAAGDRVLRGRGAAFSFFEDENADEDAIDFDVDFACERATRVYLLPAAERAAFNTPSNAMRLWEAVRRGDQASALDLALLHLHLERAHLLLIGLLLFQFLRLVDLLPHVLVDHAASVELWVGSAR